MPGNDVGEGFSFPASAGGLKVAPTFSHTDLKLKSPGFYHDTGVMFKKDHLERDRVPAAAIPKADIPVGG
jgi:hypothetical protein